MKNIAINGFGRIGRLAFRTIIKDPTLKVVAVNDLTDSKTLAHLLKYDTAHGQMCCWDIKASGNSIVLTCKKNPSNSITLPIYSEKDPKNLPWKKLGVDLVLECTGRFVSKELSQLHIDSGAKTVLISAPAKGDIKTIVYGVNHETLTSQDTIVSGASCTTNALAPLVNALEKEYGIVSGSMTTIHAYTADQKLQDSPHADLRRARAASASIIPTTTGAAVAIGKVIPSLLNKLDGVAHRVPVVTGSLVDLIVNLKKVPGSVEELNNTIKNYSNESFEYCVDPIVSADVVSHTAGSIFDSLMTKILDTGEVKLYTWYDNESSYVNQLVRTLKYFVDLR